MISSLFSKSKEEYCSLVYTCAIASFVVYEKNPVSALNEKYCTHNHKIVNISSSITTDMDENAMLETKYIICDCSIEEDGKKHLVVAVRGSYNKPDVLTNVKVRPTNNESGYGFIHGGYLSRAQCIPLDVFVDKILQGYKITFTGHSMGGAVAAILTYKVLQDPRLMEFPELPIQFIGFGVPLLACESFKDEIARRGWNNNFHFFINGKDVVPRTISLLSHVVKSISDSKIIDNACRYIQLLSSVLMGSSEGITEIGIPVLKFLLKSIEPTFKNLVGTFVPFGNQIMIYYHDTEQLVVENQTDVFNVSKTQFLEMWNVESLQSHSMVNYITEIGEICKKVGVSICNHSTFFGLYNGKKYVAESKEFLFLNDNKIQGYKLRLIQNEASMEVRISISTEPNHLVNYFTNVVVTSPPCTYKGVRNEESGELVFCLTGVLSDFMCGNKIHRKEITLQLYTHFNVVHVTLPITQNPEKGQTAKQEKISKLPTNLLYLYALSFMFGTKTISNETIVKQREEVKRCIAALDELGSEETLNINQTNNSDIYNALISTFSEDANDLGSNLIELLAGSSYYFNTKMQTLSGSTDFQGIIQNKFPVILHHSNRLSFPIKQTFTEKVGVGIGLSGFAVSAGVASALMFVPGINIVACGYLLGAGFTVSAVALGSFVASYISKNKANFHYEMNLKTIITSIGLNHNHTIPTCYHWEKQIYDWSRSENGIFKHDNDEYIISNWSKFFQIQSTVYLVSNSNRPIVLKMIRQICINYELRKTLMTNLYFGVVGMKKCGKSTFVEKLLHTDTKASSTEATTEIKAYPISKDIPSIAVWDYPHFESLDVTHKIQFFTSRFLMDYFVVVYHSEIEGDSTLAKTHLNLIKTTGSSGVAVLMNKADTIWSEHLTRDILQDKKDMIAQRLELDSRVELLEYSSLDSKVENVSSLQQCGILLMTDLRVKLWNELTKLELIPENQRQFIKEKWMELANLDKKKVKIIFFKKGKKLKLDFTWEAISKLSFGELCDNIMEEFDFESITIVSKKSQNEILDMESLINHPEHEFEVFQ